jgi:hypothetical protein
VNAPVIQRIAIGVALLAFLLIAGWNVATPGFYYDELLFVDAAQGGPNGIFKFINFGSLPVMLMPYIGELCDEGRMRIGDTGPRQIIQWISKAWTAHELTLPVFYRESLARILALERFRNLIETNIEAGITLYTDHKPALFENYWGSSSGYLD